MVVGGRRRRLRGIIEYGCDDDDEDVYDMGTLCIVGIWAMCSGYKHASPAYWMERFRHLLKYRYTFFSCIILYAAPLFKS
jgi:hypothetical protein